MSTACTSCGRQNGADCAFCTACGTALSLRCAQCGRAADADASFCGGCGHALAAPQLTAPASPPQPVAPAAPAGERKQVTVLFADVSRSMDLAERLDADELSQVMPGLFDLCREAVERFGGTVDKFTGDGVMALFGAPVAQEDHARRACHAALRLVEGAASYALTLRQRGLDLAVRVGLNSGEVVAGSVGGNAGAYTAVGHTVGLAQRMETMSKPGVPYLSEHTAALVAEAFLLRGLGKVEVKGSAATTSWRPSRSRCPARKTGRRR